MPNMQINLPIDAIDELLGFKGKPSPEELAGARPIGAGPAIAPPMTGASPALPPLRMPSPALGTIADYSGPGSLPMGGPAPIAPQRHSTLGKIGHVFGDIGQIAGSALIPHLMPSIPGTRQYKEREADRASQEREAESAMARQEASAGLMGAQAGEARARTFGLEHPERKAPQTVDTGTGQRMQFVNGQWVPLGEPTPAKLESMKQNWRSIPGTNLEIEATTGQTRAIEGLQRPVPDKDRYMNLVTNLKTGKPVSSEDMAWGKAYEAANQRVTTSVDPFGFKGSSISGPSALGGLGPTGTEQAGGRTSEAQSLVDMIGKGKIAPERLTYLLAREPMLMAAVSQQYPDFDSSKVASYAETYREFTRGRTASFINAGAAALQHLRDLKKINDENTAEVHIPGSASNKRYENLLNTVSGELIRFYGQPETNEAISAMKDTMGGFFGGVGGFNRDAAIQEQAQAMGIKLDSYEQQWKSAAPSAVYEAPMPGISTAAKKARAELDPNYEPGSQLGLKPGEEKAPGGKKVRNASDYLKKIGVQ